MNANGCIVYLSGVTTCGVTTPLSAANGGFYSGGTTVDCAGDTDSDGLADSWEMQYFNTLAYNGADDPDGDGINNQQENQAGTNPAVATSLPEPDFTSDPLYSAEPREVVENFHGDYVAPNDTSLASMEITTSWRNRVLQGTSETCLYYYEGEISSSCWFDDWRSPPSGTHLTNNVQESTYGLWEFGLSDMPQRYANNITGYGPTDDDCWVQGGLGSWSYSCSDEFWVTVANGGTISYVYKVDTGIYPHEFGGPFECSWTFWPKSTSYATISVGGAPVNTDGYAYFALQEGVPFNLTPRDSSLNYYAYQLPLIYKYQAPSDPYLASSGTTIDPDFPAAGLAKYGPNGWGYDRNKLTNVVDVAGTQITGIPATNSIGDIGILAEIGFWVPSIPDFITGWAWHQDVHFEDDYYDPLQNTNRVFPVGRKSWTPNAPSANGNDDPVGFATDPTLDIGRYIFMVDNPGILLSKGGYSTLHTGSIIAMRFAARSWPTWNGAVMSNLAKWHITLTLKITSARYASTTTAKVVNYSIGTGATMTPMSLQEAQQYYNQP